MIVCVKDTPKYLYLFATIKDALKYLTNAFQTNPDIEPIFQTCRLHRCDAQIQNELKHHWTHLDAEFGRQLYPAMRYNVRKLLWKHGELQVEIELAVSGSSAERFLRLAHKETDLTSVQGFVKATPAWLEMLKTSQIIFENDELQELHALRKTLHEKRSRALDECLMHRRLEWYLLYGIPGATPRPANPLVAMDEKQSLASSGLDAVREQIMSLALEEMVSNHDLDSQTAYDRARKRIQTTGAIGAFRELAIDAELEIAKVPKDLVAIRDHLLDLKKKQQEAKEQEGLELYQLARTFDSFASCKRADRVARLFPILFPNAKQLEVAQRWASTLFTFGGYASPNVIYGCYFDDQDVRRKPNFCFHASLDKLHRTDDFPHYKTHWCAYVTILDETKYVKAHMYHKDSDATRVSLYMSGEGKLCQEYFRVRTLQDIVQRANHECVTEDFIMRFVVAIACPAIVFAKHNLYTLWAMGQ